MMEIEYTSQAVEDLAGIKEYISVDLANPKSGQKIVNDIVHRIDSLSELPEIGAPLSSRISEKSDYRYLICSSYNVFYRIENQTVKIIRILNARRNFMAILFGKNY